MHPYHAVLSIAKSTHTRTHIKGAPTCVSDAEAELGELHGGDGLLEWRRVEACSCQPVVCVHDRVHDGIDPRAETDGTCNIRLSHTIL